MCLTLESLDIWPCGQAPSTNFFGKMYNLYMYATPGNAAVTLRSPLETFLKALKDASHDEIDTDILAESGPSEDASHDEIDTDISAESGPSEDASHDEIDTDISAESGPSEDASHDEIDTDISAESGPSEVYIEDML
ncbi:uncharacterized protein [Apostichopus japonicus]|uniref:uncharacterized protein n=1 Tax=Stichopus japonicus TaxID=307972 RepID=UPI003AB23E3E